MLKCISFFILYVFMSSQSLAQISIDANGAVAIGATPVSSLYKVPVLCDNTTNCSSFTKGGVYSISRFGNYNRALIGQVEGAYNGYGVYGIAKTTGSNSNHNTGVYGSAQGGQQSNYGIKGYASGPNSWAGYFSGSVYTTGSYQSSDSRLKKNVKRLNGINTLHKLLELNPRKYEYLTERELKRRSLPSLHTKRGIHYGLLAQELETIYPELVVDVLHVMETETNSGFEDSNETKPETVTTKAINYQELTVLLLVAVQELQKKLQNLESKLNNLK